MARSKMEEIQLQMKKQREDLAYRERQRVFQEKTPAVQAYQRKEISSAEYVELTGESYAETMRESMEIDVLASQARMRVKVTEGLITEEEYLYIIGEAPRPIEA